MVGKAEEDEINLSEKQIKDLKNVFEKGNVRELQKKLHSLESICLNIGVTGEQVSGKSMFNNSIWDLREKDDGTARTGMRDVQKDPTS